jgi:diguanylate cyclase (GGDEF)-like protein
VVTSLLPQVNTGLSMGIASLESTQVVDAEALVKAADRALYQAKAAGKNCVKVAGTGHRVG